MKQKILRRVLSGTSGLIFALYAPSALAQAADGAQPGDAPAAGEIIVTARGRTEALLTSPVAITAFSSKALDDARIKNVSDFIGLTPNISIVQSQSAGNSFVTIRGISQVRNGEAPIAVVTDGVQQVTSRQFTSDLFDVQQIEVLRGPQGALYGRNAIGGAILITTKQPTNDFHVDAQVSAGNGQDYRGEVSISGPIVRDKLLFRLSGSARNFGGLLHNIYLGQTVDKVHDRNVRGQLKAFLSDTLTADLRASYTHTSAIGDQFLYQPANLTPGTCFLDPANPFGGPAPDANRVSRDFCANNRGRNTRSIAEASLKLENKADWGTITNVFSVVQVKEYLGGDQFPYTASRNVFGTDGTQTQYENLKAWQNDFRIASPAGNRFRWMIGAYYLKTTRFISTTTGLDNGLGIVEIHREPDHDNPINPTLSFLADNNHNQAYAFYGNVAYDITPKLEASFAYRYDHDRRHQMISPLSSAGLPTGCTLASTSACGRIANFHKGQPKVTLNYKASPDLTLFADYGIGFRSGQYNQSGAAAAANLPGVFDLVRQESASTAEGGFKARLLGGRLRINGTGFYTRDKNPFYFVFVGAVGAQILVNIDKVDLYGGEIEATFTPIKGLDIYANYGYTHSEIKKFAFNPADVGNWAPYIPRDGGALGAQYRFPVTDRLNLFARGEVEHHGKQYWDPENSTARSSFQLVNLRGGVESANGRWTLTGYVRNLTDKKYNAEFVSGGFVQPAEPRTYGVELRTSF
ncbi:TonB-dependent receptor [Flavisphingomonas formosensis]|uniref:TonB-dependent receptor n=1 Tax=Flavisphingomonas formosensis TaxID=861534 RepID=UPI0012FA36FA|nr:TonB-dependent receptor [Sphingomonas formosensis]